MNEVPEGGAPPRERIEATIASLQGMLAKEPTLYELHYNLGVLYQSLGDAKKARGEYELALLQDPGNRGAHLNLGLLLLQDDKVKEAEQHFQTLSSLDPQFAGSFYLLGVCQHKRGALAEAEENLKKAVSLLPSFLYPYIELGALLKKTGREEEARENLSVVLHHPNASARELRKLAYTLIGSGWLPEAIAAFDRLEKTKDSLYEDLNNRAVAYLRKGELDRARSDLEKAVEKDPSRPEAFNNIGITCVREKEYESAVAYFLHAVRLRHSFLPALLNAAVVYGQYWEDNEKARRYAADYLNRGGRFQRSMLKEWLGST
jgi:Tfp pilus assembly protein PilF